MVALLSAFTMLVSFVNLIRGTGIVECLYMLILAGYLLAAQFWIDSRTDNGWK